ncbi:DUF6737 family protein [Alkalinema sp. FACHB-956]|uniref:DUF6737 family protein n=1 Tax=Alkalinema sp. FACHB-956 TaxID=2692768 RepID=UPI001689104E|nr:DUF6737 family protein [Alkalinema sp. FACHB-956]MBD2325395.1 hypothetical protein [Alkalinema sp. FACHB-956]
MGHQGSEPTVWQYKPWWCQPWSIVLTGLTLITGSWWLLRMLWVTVLVAIPIGLWMVYFVLIYPKLMAQSGLLEEIASQHSAGDPDRSQD